MRAARRKVGLSADEIAHRMKRSGYSKAVPRTYLRWEARGEVPRDALPTLAPILGLDLEKILIDQPTRLQLQQVGEVLAQILTAVQALTQTADELRQIANELRPPEAANLRQ